MRPVDKGGDPPYTTKTEFQFAGGNRLAVSKFVAAGSTASKFPIDDCLDLWLAKVKNSPLPPSTTLVQRDTAVSAIENQVNGLYKTASVPLTERLGPFCSYCESPLSGLLEVEHCAPKSNYPTFSTSWNNFLLSCGPCNTAKLDKPDRPTATGWTGKPAPTEQELYSEIRGMHYTWPDMDDEAYDWMPHALQFHDGATWQTMKMTAAADIRNIVLSISVSTRTVTARIYDGATTHTLPVRVVVVSDTSGKTPDNAQETIDMCNLNGVSETMSTYDRRMMNRTLAWFACLKSLSHLTTAAGSGMAQIVWDQMLMTAVSTGFYSVWLSLVDYVFPGDAHKFVTDTNKALYFPGTNTAELP